MFLKLFFPDFCFFCLGTLDLSLFKKRFPLSLICQGCFQNLDFTYKNNYCFYCSEILLSSKICSDCQIRSSRMSVYFDRNISLFPYNSLVRSLLNYAKYNRKIHFYYFLAEFFVKIYKNFFKEKKSFYVTAVPSYKTRIYERSMDHVFTFAFQIAEFNHLIFVKDILIKIKDNISQSKLNLKNRLLNPKGVFSINKNFHIQSQNFFLIDDILTTGTTVNEIAYLLKEKGANEVIVLTIAKSSLN